MKRLCFVVSSPLTVRVFLLDHIREFAKACDVQVVADFGSLGSGDAPIEGIRCISIPIRRAIALVSDLKALVLLYLFFKRSRFDAVHSVTPKAGLLSMVASWAANVPIRVHTFTGQVWATRKGLARHVLKVLDCVTSSCATEVLVDSPSQRNFLLAEGVIDRQRSTVLADGSICGVDLQRFRKRGSMRDNIRQSLAIPSESFLFLFLGRLNAEKGIPELTEAFKMLISEGFDAFLLLVGPDEGGMMDALGDPAHARGTRIVHHGYTSNPEHYMAAADAFCLPSHREGFGSVIIEAAAVGVPAIGARIYGITDAVSEGETGLLHEVGNAKDLFRCMKVLVSNRDLNARLGVAALDRARLRFSRERVVAALMAFYAERGIV